MTSYFELQDHLHAARKRMMRRGTPGAATPPAPKRVAPPTPVSSQARSLHGSRARQFTATPVSFRVPGLVQPIRQPKSADCWAAVTTMMVNWREEMSQEIRTVIARYGDKYLGDFDSNAGLPLADWPDLMVRAGLVAEPPMNYAPEGWVQMLRSYGPVFVFNDGGAGPNDGWTHARIIVGIDGDGTRLSIVDPATGSEYTETLNRFAQLYEAPNALQWTPQVVHWPAGSRVSQVKSQSRPQPRSWGASASRSHGAWRPRAMETDAGTPQAGTTAIPWGARVSSDFRSRVQQIAAGLGVDAGDLMSVMAFESGETFSPAIRNKRSGATGLIQFMPRTARDLGTSTDDLAAMTAEAQLDYVERYLSGKRKPLRTLEDLYMAVLWPAAIGLLNETVIFVRGDKRTGTAYMQNGGLDRDGDGRITKAEASAFVRAKRAKGEQPGNAG